MQLCSSGRHLSNESSKVVLVSLWCACWCHVLAWVGLYNAEFFKQTSMYAQCYGFYGRQVSTLTFKCHQIWCLSSCDSQKRNVGRNREKRDSLALVTAEVILPALSIIMILCHNTLRMIIIHEVEIRLSKIPVITIKLSKPHGTCPWSPQGHRWWAAGLAAAGVAVLASKESGVFV